MYMKNKAALFPTIFAIVMAIAGLGIPIPGTTGGTPWLTAIHSQTMPDGQVVNVDNIAFFLWGHQYTVVGQTTQNTFTPYDWRDFPFYSMILILLAAIAGVLSIIVSRSTNITIRGKEIKTRIPGDIGTTFIGRDIRIGTSMLILVMATLLMVAGTIYLDYSARMTIIPILQQNNYIINTGYGFQFMEIGVIGFVLSVVMTRINTKMVQKAEKEDAEEVEEDIE
ncbi:Uncharacterised protein [uncultured archaeon]|nr:Uncharacterised protein [uncultured archaeon]